MFSDHGKMPTEQEVRNSQRDDTLVLAEKFVEMVPDSFIGGSVLIDKYGANDVDIVVPEWSWHTLDMTFSMAFNLIRYDPTEDNYEQDAINNEIQALYSGPNGLNVIVVSTAYYPAYLAGKLEYERHPELYKHKPDRVTLHKDMKQVIRDMLSGEWAENARIPVAALVSNQKAWSYGE